MHSESSQMIPTTSTHDGSSDTSSQKKTLIVGDIHGCDVQLQDLLKKANFNPELDQLVHVGDLVNKGADSIKVVRRCMHLNALGVRGNHEDDFLRVVKKLKRSNLRNTAIEEHEVSSQNSSSSAISSSSSDNNSDCLSSGGSDDNEENHTDPGQHQQDGDHQWEDEIGHKLSGKRLKVLTVLAKQFLDEPDGDALINYLSALPYTLPLPKLNVLVVHAGFCAQRVGQRCLDCLAMMTAVPLRQDITSSSSPLLGLEELNQLILDSHRTDELNTYSFCEDPYCPAGSAWAEEWSELSAQISSSFTSSFKSPLIIFGHDAREKVQDLRPYSLGLDTDCPRSGMLSAALFVEPYEKDMAATSCTILTAHCPQSRNENQRLRTKLILNGIPNDITAKQLEQLFFSGPMEDLGTVWLNSYPGQTTQTGILNCCNSLVATTIFDSLSAKKKSLSLLPPETTFKMFFKKPRSDVKLSIRGLHSSVNNQRLFNVFVRFGRLKASGTFVASKNAPPGTGLVTFYEPDAAEKARVAMHGQLCPRLCGEGTVLGVYFADK